MFLLHYPSILHHPFSACLIRGLSSHSPPLLFFLPYSNLFPLNSSSSLPVSSPFSSHTTASLLFLFPLHSLHILQLFSPSSFSSLFTFYSFSSLPLPFLSSSYPIASLFFLLLLHSLQILNLLFSSSSFFLRFTFFGDTSLPSFLFHSSLPSLHLHFSLCLFSFLLTAYLTLPPLYPPSSCPFSTRPSIVLSSCHSPDTPRPGPACPP